MTRPKIDFAEMKSSSGLILNDTRNKLQKENYTKIKKTKKPKK